MAVRYITVTPETNMFKPATRSFGDVAIIGNTALTAQGPALAPIPITNPNSVTHSDYPGIDAAVDDAQWFEGDLGESVVMAFKQSPGPSKVYAVRADMSDANALGDALDEVAKLNVQLVAMANCPLGAASLNQTQIEALAGHVNTVSNTGGDGKERIGIAMFDNGFVDSSAITGNMAVDRMVMVAHNSSEDAAAAFAGTIAGYEPHISVLLKPVTIDMPSFFTDSVIDSLDAVQVNWLTRPDVMPGLSIYAGEAYTLGTDKPYIDIVRTIDDVSFKLKARLIVAIGKLRVSRAGLKNLASMMSGVLEPLVMREVIEAYDIFIPVLQMLDKDPSSLTEAELQMIANAQNTRTVEATITVDYAGAIHRLNIRLIFE